VLLAVRVAAATVGLMIEAPQSSTAARSVVLAVEEPLAAVAS
jgi:hypothetical protein